jgi:ubiquinone/menaquinone biosynthesis C-methylase UbiE
LRNKQLPDTACAGRLGLGVFLGVVSELWQFPVFGPARPQSLARLINIRFNEENMAYSPEAVRKTYDEIAEREDQFEKEFSLRNEIPREFVKKYLQTSDVVLDAGGGSGINAILMAQGCRKVTLIDISPKLLQLARMNIQEKGFIERIDLREGDISNLEFLENETFSFVVCLGGTLSYVLEKGQQAICELVRVARSGAIIIIGCDSKYGFVRWLFNEVEPEDQLEITAEVYEAGEYEAGEGIFARLYTASELTTLLKNAGCEIMEVGSTPILADSWEQNSYPKEKQQKLIELELKFCTLPELLGAGHHLFCVARKL